MKTICIHMLCNATSATSHYRAVLPVRFCGPTLAKEGIDLRICTKLRWDQYPHAVIVQRNLGPEGFAMFGLFRFRGSVIVHDCDDWIEGIPEHNRSLKDDFNHVVQMTRASQGIAHLRTASTDYLSEKMGGTNFVLPNLIDLDEYQGRKENRADAPVRILWAGGFSHDEDLALLVDPLRRVLEKYGTRVRVMFWGDYPPELVAEYQGKGVSFLPGVPIGEYARNLVGLDPDIGLCPLVDSEFTRSKSNIKILEMSAAGAAVVASPVGPYEGFPSCQWGVTDLYANSAPDWHVRLARHICDKEWREHVATTMREYVADEWSWQGATRKRESWLAFFRMLASVRVERWPEVGG